MLTQGRRRRNAAAPSGPVRARRVPRLCTTSGALALGAGIAMVRQTAASCRARALVTAAHNCLCADVVQSRACLTYISSHRPRRFDRQRCQGQPNQ
ncbi:hypothetical protein D9X30_2061 [Cupriavidus sp. U2]|nr:hypothetical protein D9X30_2061 [Cupriavidus sp. U2]